MDNIIIVGGGSAGWMTATTLLSQFPDKKISLVESPNINTIGVGEGTVPNIGDWLKLVGINYYDFMPHTDAVFKLSIAFKDWYRKDSGTFHYPFGPFVAHDLNPGQIHTHQHPHDFELNDWHLKKIFYPETPVSDYADSFYPAMALVNQNKYFPSDSNRGELDSYHAYGFDATKFGIWLRDNIVSKYSNKFTHILAEVESIVLDDNGIKYLILDNGQKLEGDLFIDCTGFQSLLLTKTFDVSMISIENYVPNNHAWVTKIPYKDKETQLVNYTLCTAIENGWIWEIPLWSRIGSGYVFSDKFISTDAALREFKHALRKNGHENVGDLEYRLIPMQSGIQSKLWVKNACAIGLSAGFIEPLQSNGLQCIHYSLFNLVQTLEREHISEWDRKEFTAKCHDDFYSLALVVALSYVLSHRDDTEYWKDILNRDWTPEPFDPELGGLSTHFRGAYIQKRHRWQFNSQHEALHCMSTGMNWNPINRHTVKYGGDSNRLKDIKKEKEIVIQEMEKRKKRWSEQIKDFPSPYQYAKENIHYEI